MQSVSIRDWANSPLFNPDLDADSLPAVTGLRDAILAANVLMLASPEYATA
ncbi:hypothetical protein [Janthinobacterium sp. LB3P118]|uniref:hypothetical protein n=1 Tax=Janthinobacterium sp. LB3P118 TaxID=3424195 RepID=UPI003F210E46